MEIDYYTVLGFVFTLVIYKLVSFGYKKINNLQQEISYIFEATKSLSAAQKSFQNLENFIEGAKKNTYMDIALYSVTGMAIGSMIGAYATHRLSKDKRKKQRSNRKCKESEMNLSEMMHPLLQATIQTLDDTDDKEDVDKKRVMRDFLSNLVGKLNPTPKPKSQWVYGERTVNSDPENYKSRRYNKNLKKHKLRKNSNNDLKNESQEYSSDVSSTMSNTDSEISSG